MYLGSVSSPTFIHSHTCSLCILVVSKYLIQLQIEVIQVPVFSPQNFGQEVQQGHIGVLSRLRVNQCQQRCQPEPSSLSPPHMCSVRVPPHMCSAAAATDMLCGTAGKPGVCETQADTENCINSKD